MRKACLQLKQQRSRSCSAGNKVKRDTFTLRHRMAWGDSQHKGARL